MALPEVSTIQANGRRWTEAWRAEEIGLKCHKEEAVISRTELKLKWLLPALVVCLCVPVSASGALTGEFPAVAGEAGEGVVFSRPSFRHVGHPEKAAAFIEAYTAKYGSEPQDYAAYGYDALKLVAQVMDQGNRTSEESQLAMRAPDARYEGITGEIVFGNEGDVVASPTAFIVKDGAVILYQDYLEQGGLPPGASPEEE